MSGLSLDFSEVNKQVNNKYCYTGPLLAMVPFSMGCLMNSLFTRNGNCECY